MVHDPIELHLAHESVDEDTPTLVMHQLIRRFALVISHQRNPENVFLLRTSQLVVNKLFLGLEQGLDLVD